jgi:hypothetical protein
VAHRIPKLQAWRREKIPSGHLACATSYILPVANFFFALLDLRSLSGGGYRPSRKLDGTNSNWEYSTQVECM